MLAITKRAAEQLKGKLLNVYMRAGGMDNLPVDSQTKEILKKRLMQNCLETGLGFRMLVENDRRGYVSLVNLKIDIVKKEDDVCKKEGILVFIDHESSSLLGDSEIDYIDDPKGSFTLRQCDKEVIAG